MLRSTIVFLAIVFCAGTKSPFVATLRADKIKGPLYQDTVEYHMGSSLRSARDSTVNDVAILKNKKVKQFFSYNGTKIKDDIKYGRYGIDISHWQGEIKWNLLIQDTIPDRIYFMIAKATQGTTMVDKVFKTNFANAKKYAKAVGAYHFYIQTADPVIQAQNFINTVQLVPGDLMPILDIENNCFSNCGNTPDLLIPKSQLITNLKKFISVLEEYYKTKVIIYTGEAFYNDYLAADFKENYFWIAKYSKDPPACFTVEQFYTPSNPCYKNSRKGCWQYTQSGRVKGIDTDVDLNFITNYYLLKWVIK